MNAQKPSYSIGFLFDKLEPEARPIIEQLKKEIKTVVGEDAIINFSMQNQLENDFNFEKARQQYNELVSKTDMIISFGLYNNIIINKESSFPKPTILIGGFHSEIANFDASKKASGINNFTYMVTSNSYAKDVEQFKKLSSFKKLGIVIEKPLMDAVDFNAIFNSIKNDVAFDFKLIPFDNVSDITSNLIDIDALYFAGGFSLDDTEVQQVSQALIEKKLPSFSSIRKSDVANGIMASTVSDDNIEQFFRRIALNVEAVHQRTKFFKLTCCYRF